MASSSKLPIIVAAALIVVVTAGTVLMRRGGEAAEAPAEGTAGAAPTAVAEPPGPPRAGPRVPGAGESTQIERALDRRNQMRDQHIARTAELKKNAAATFEREAVDPAWAPQKEADLQDVAGTESFETAGVTPQDLSIECKSSMCRVDGKFASNGEAEDWLVIYMSSLGGKMPNAVVSRSRNPDGSTRVQIYGRGR